MGAITGMPGQNGNSNTSKATGDFSGQALGLSPGGGGNPLIDYRMPSTMNTNIAGAKSLGGHGSAAGTGSFPTPVMPNIQMPVAPGQGGVDHSLASQNALLAALGGQNGVGNQSGLLAANQNYGGQMSGEAPATIPGLVNQNAAAGSQTALNGQLGGGAANTASAVAGMGGLNAQMAGQAPVAAGSGLAGQEGAMAGLQGAAAGYGDLAAGRGANPAQAMLNQQTGANVANQAALMAGQRGAAANVGLIARQAAQQGAATQQQAVGQGATMQAQQQIAGLEGQVGANSALGGLGGAMVGEQQAGLGQLAQTGLAQTGAQQTGINSLAAQGATQVGQLQSQQGINANITNAMVGNQIGAQGQAVQGNLANAGQQLGAAGQFNTNVTSGQGNVNTGNTAMNVESMKGRQGLAGGLMNGAGGALASLGGGAAAATEGGSAAGGLAGGDASAAEIGDIAATAARGGYVHKMADGGELGATDAAPTIHPLVPIAQQSPNGPQSAFGRFIKGVGAGTKPETMGQQGSSAALNTGASSLLQGLATAAGSRGGLAAKGGGVKAENPGEKATKPGNSYANDKIKTVLSEGEVVLPRSVMQSKDPVRSAADFVSKVIAKRKGKQ